MKTEIDGTKTYELKCPVCGKVLMADGEDNGNPIAFEPCEHIVLQIHRAGLFEMFSNMSPNMTEVISAIIESQAQGWKAHFLLKDEPAIDEETYKDMVEDSEIDEAIRKELEESEAYLIVDMTFAGGCCSGPCYNFEDSFVFKMENE